MLTLQVIGSDFNFKNVEYLQKCIIFKLFTFNISNKGKRKTNLTLEN